MKLTKFKHSCFMLEHDGQSLIVDPGNWSIDFVDPGNVTVIMLTHEHSDHFDKDLLQGIVDKNPEAVIIAPHEMTEKLAGFSTKGVFPGDSLTVGAFRLSFFGGEHAPIHPEIASVVNVGVLVNNSFYYPGDSFTLPGVPVKTLALPVTAPWLKISEPIDFMIEVKPELAFPVHDHIASDDGKALVDRILGGFAEKNSIRYQRITGSLDI